MGEKTDVPRAFPSNSHFKLRPENYFHAWAGGLSRCWFSEEHGWHLMRTALGDGSTNWPSIRFPTDCSYVKPRWGLLGREESNPRYQLGKPKTSLDFLVRADYFLVTGFSLFPLDSGGGLPRMSSNALSFELSAAMIFR